jgi:hypothetical protein
MALITALLINMEQLVEWELAGETDVLWKIPSQCHFVHHKPHYDLTWAGTWAAAVETRSWTWCWKLQTALLGIEYPTIQAIAWKCVLVESHHLSWDTFRGECLRKPCESQGVKVTTNCHLVPRARPCWAVTVIPKSLHGWSVKASARKNKGEAVSVLN